MVITTFGILRRRMCDAREEHMSAVVDLIHGTLDVMQENEDLVSCIRDDAETVRRIAEENALLREHLATLMRGVRDALCSNYETWNCRQDCPMYVDERECAWTRALDACGAHGIETEQT